MHLKSTRMPIISPLQLVPPYASKSIGNSDGSPFHPDNSHHKRKKDQDLRPSSPTPKLGQGSSLRSQPCPSKGPTARAVAGGVQAVACTEQEVACTVHAIAYTEQAVVCAVHAVAGAMHHDHVPIHRLGIRKRLSQAAQEVKPEASSLSNPWSALRSGVTRG